LNPGRYNSVIFAGLLLLQLFFMSGTARRSGVTRACESAVMWVSAPVVELSRSVAGGARDGVTGARDLLAAHTRNAALELEVERLRTEFVQVREAAPENRRLRNLLRMREELTPNSISASLVTAHIGRRSQTVVIDRGSDDGVAVDMAVVAWGGAVGRVIMVDSGHAKVRLLSDRSSGVAGIVQRSRAQGIVQGRAGGALHMLYVPRYSDVVHGDRVVTSGLDGVFPRGYGIGHVSSITQAADGAQTIHLEPAIDFSTIEEVMVVLDPPSSALIAPATAAGGGG
jgi:rod shape-determining protein MreC